MDSRRNWPVSAETKLFDLKSQSLAFEDAQPEEVLRWAISHFGDKLCMSTSFQLGGMVLIDMLSKIDRNIPVLFLDTGFHFPETLAFRDQVAAHYKINLITLVPALPRDTFIRIYGDDRLYERNRNECCRINKVEPMKKALERYSAQLISLRRDQSADRANIQILEERLDGVTLIHPLARWSREDSLKYLKDNAVPSHPLHEKGYKSIGCSPECCTQPVGAHAPERAGRWTGTGKSECGLHLDGKRRIAQDFSI
jgi:phosphoadenosine phosphosulfate reductase